MLIIKHLSGPLAGTETSIAAQQARIVFGRGGDCDVRYPADARLVAHHHFAIARRPSGDWTVELFGHPFVMLDGNPAERGQLVRDGARIELGQRGGPSFAVHVARDPITDNYPPTAPQPEPASPLAALQGVERSTARQRYVVAAAAVVAVAAAAIGGYSFFNTGTLQQSLEAYQKLSVETGALAIGKDTRERLKSSVYHVLKRNNVKKGASLVGTAWPVGPHKLATTARVAMVREGLAKDETLVVKAPGPEGQEFAVVADRVHPAYKPLQDFLQSDPIWVRDVAGRYWPAGLDVAGYDVGVLEVREILPPDVILTVASDAEARSLKVGDAVMTAGYPSLPTASESAEAVVSGQMGGVVASSPDEHFGTVSALTDFFFLPGDADHRQLVHDSLPTTDGDRGSPIVDAAGHVVAIMSAGNVIKLPKRRDIPRRLPSAAFVDFGQRIDLLNDMLRDTAAKSLERERAYWKQQIANFGHGMDAMIEDIVAKTKPTDATASVVFNQDLELPADYRAQIVVPVEPATTYVFVAYGRDEAPLQLHLMLGKDVVAANTDARWYPFLKFVNKEQTQMTVVVSSALEQRAKYILRAYKLSTKSPTG